MYEDVNNFLAHFGVKGMRWGVRNDRSRGTSKTGSPTGNGGGHISKSEAKAAGLAAAKITLKYGAVPGAVAIGGAVGVPAIAALAVSVRVLQDPAVQTAATVAGNYVKNSFGDMPMSKIPNPFSNSEAVKTSKVASSSAYENLPKEKSGGMFNPDSDISGGKIQDVGSPTDQVLKDWDPYDHKYGPVNERPKYQGTVISPARVVGLGAGVMVSIPAAARGIKSVVDKRKDSSHAQ